MSDNGSPEPVFTTDDSSYVLVTLPVHGLVSNQASNRANNLIFNNLEEIIAFGNQVGNGASNGAGFQAINILSESIHNRVAEMLSLLQNGLNGLKFLNKWI